MVLLGESFPNFTANTTEGQINFHEWLADSWGILFSYPADYTPVCTTELARLNNLMPEFNKRNVKVIGLSCDPAQCVTAHQEWSKDTLSDAGISVNQIFPYPIIVDKDRSLAKKLGIIEKDELDAPGIPLTARAVLIVDNNKKFRLSLMYPATTGRNFTEVLRVIDSMQLTDTAKVATPVDWQVGDDCIVLPSVAEDDLIKVFPDGVAVVPMPSGKKYLRKTACPKVE